MRICKPLFPFFIPMLPQETWGRESRSSFRPIEPSQTENLYFVLFIEDFTRMCWVNFMRNKSDVCHVFKKIYGSRGSTIRMQNSGFETCLYMLSFLPS